MSDWVDCACCLNFSLLLLSISFPNHIFSSWPEWVNWLCVVMETLLRSCIASLVMKTDRPCWRSVVSWTSPSLPQLSFFYSHRVLTNYFPDGCTEIEYCTLLLYTKTMIPGEGWQIQHYVSLLNLLPQSPESPVENSHQVINRRWSSGWHSHENAQAKTELQKEHCSPPALFLLAGSNFCWSIASFPKNDSLGKSGIACVGKIDGCMLLNGRNKPKCEINPKHR